MQVETVINCRGERESQRERERDREREREERGKERTRNIEEIATFRYRGRLINILIKIRTQRFKKKIYSKMR